MPRSVGTDAGMSPSTVIGAVAQLERGDRIAPDEAEPAPPLAVLDGLEQEARAVADQLRVRGDRRLEVGEQLGPHRHDRVVGGERAELVAARAASRARVAAHVASSTSAPKRRKKHEYAPVWQAPLPSWTTLNSSTSASQS